MIKLFRRATKLLNNDSKKTKLWFKIKNPNFSDIAPLTLIKLGNKSKVETFVKAVEEEY